MPPEWWGYSYFMSDDPIADAEDFTWRNKRRRPGRPRGSANRAPIVLAVGDATVRTPDSQRLPNITEMIAAQLRLVQSAQATVAAKLADKGVSMKEISDLSAALDKSMAAVSRAAATEADILSRMSQAQHIEAAILRLEACDEGVRNLAIRRLRRADDAPTGPKTASDAIAALDDE